MNLIKINLLPYREILEQKQKKRFQLVMAGGVIAGGVAAFLERKQKVEELDNKRFEGARIVDTVNQLVPEGAYLTAIQNIGGSDATISNTYTLVGKAISDNKVAMFMTALPSTGVFDIPKLDSINKTDNGQEFKVTANLLEQKKLAATQSSISAETTTTSASAPAASATTE